VSRLRRLLCLLGHSWTYLITPPAVTGWCMRCCRPADHLRTATTPAGPDNQDTADAASTFELLADVLAGKPIEPTDPRADTLTLIKITALLTFMRAPAQPATVLDIVRERLAAAEDTAAVRHLFDEQGRPL
jgi:hypothetical protein